jgi:aspartyl-tRNA(Asn)/glutamyl-tRNA(Gln) amidotransferase subunit B
MRDVVGAGALELVVATIESGASPAAAKKWWLTEMARRSNEQGVDIGELAITPAQVAEIQKLIDDGRINDKLARQVFEGVLAGEGSPEEVINARGLELVSDDAALGEAVDRAIVANPDVADKIRDGKLAAAGALIGAVMKDMRGQADAGRVRELILERLS